MTTQTKTTKISWESSKGQEQANINVAGIVSLATAVAGKYKSPYGDSYEVKETTFWVCGMNGNNIFESQHYDSKQEMMDSAQNFAKAVIANGGQIPRVHHN